ncbi:MAG: DNA translocase FtsK [bacterium]|nr:MAG: DNA translocase FtsK [bacterium]
MDDLLEDAVNVCIQYDRASASLLQRRLSIGYARAARIIDQLESAGVLGMSDGSSKPREVLIKSYKEFKTKDDHGLVAEKKDEFKETSKEYTPIVADFLTDDIKKLLKPTDLPYIKNDLTRIGNLIVTGNVISKKYEYIKTYLLFLLSKFNLSDVRVIIDDGTGKLKKFGSIPHLLTSIIDKSEESLSSLRWLSREMDRRIEIINKDDKTTFPEIIYIGNIFSFYNSDIEYAIKRISSMGAYAKIHLILLGDRLGDFPKQIKDNIPARLEFSKFGEAEAVFSFKEKIKIRITELDKVKVIDYLANLS